MALCHGILRVTACISRFYALKVRDSDVVTCCLQRGSDALQGWRVIFFTTAGVAAGATLVVLFGGIEPRSLRPKEKVGVHERRHFF